MSVGIKITPYQLRELANKFRMKSDVVRDMLYHIDNVISNLEEYWEGASQSEYFKQYFLLRPKLNKLIETLDGIANTLDNVAQTFQNSDEQLAVQMDSVGINNISAANGAVGAVGGAAGVAAVMPFNHDLFNDETIRDIIENGSRNDTGSIGGPVELLTNAEAGAAGVGAGIFQIVDLMTMSEYRIYIGFPPGNVHSDFTPMSPQDTATMLANAGGSWNWLPRPMVLKVGGRMLACGIHSFPHGSIMGTATPGLGLSNQSNTRPAGGWPIGGHMCMYFKNSTGGTSGIREAAHAAYRIGNEIFKRQSTA